MKVKKKLDYQVIVKVAYDSSSWGWKPVAVLNTAELAKRWIEEVCRKKYTDKADFKVLVLGDKKLVRSNADVAEEIKNLHKYRLGKYLLANRDCRVTSKSVGLLEKEYIDLRRGKTIKLELSSRAPTVLESLCVDLGFSYLHQHYDDSGLLMFEKDGLVYWFAGNHKALLSEPDEEVTLKELYFKKDFDIKKMLWENQ